ncbi:MAG: hypothetical protein RIC35_14125 [Marinoscillum sp.]
MKTFFIVVALLLMTGPFCHAQSKVAKKIASPKDVNATLDFPGEGRKGKNGRGFSANLTLLEQPIKKVALVSFYVFDPGYTSSFSVSSPTVKTTHIKRRNTGGLSADIAVGALDQSYEVLKKGFSECGMELLMPWEFLDSDAKKTAYSNFKVEQESNFSNWLQGVGAANHNLVYGYPEGFNLLDISKEPFANYEKKGLFAVKKDAVQDKKVFYMNKDTKMTETLGYDLATALGVDAVVISYITAWAPSDKKIMLENVNLTMFGPNPVMPEESKHGMVPHVKGQFYVGTRAVIEEVLFDYNKKDESSQSLDFTGLDHIYSALVTEMCSYIAK